jgi:outer membrane receptor protein involved in Fe transport
VSCVGFTTYPYYPYDKFVPNSVIIPTVGTQIERTVLLRDDYDLSDRFDASLAGYYSNYNDLNVRRFDPRFALVNKPNENSVLRFSVGTGFAAPRLSDIVTPLNLDGFTSSPGPNCTPSDFYCNATSGNPNLKEETALGYDLGYEKTWAEQGDFSVDLYRTNLTNHIFDAITPAPPGLDFSGGSTPVLGIIKPINLARSVYTGIELSGALPVTQMFTVKAYYNTQASYPTGVDPLTEAEIGDVVNNEQYLGVPLHKEGYSVNFQNASHASAFIGGDWFGQNNSYNVPPFWIYNAGVSLPFTGNTQMHIAWQNIFNKAAPIFSQYNGGVAYAAANGYNGCTSGCTYPTTAYSFAPHMLSISFDTRIGSLR